MLPRTCTLARAAGHIIDGECVIGLIAYDAMSSGMVRIRPN